VHKSPQARFNVVLMPVIVTALMQRRCLETPLHRQSNRPVPLHVYYNHSQRVSITLTHWDWLVLDSYIIYYVSRVC